MATKKLKVITFDDEGNQSLVATMTLRKPIDGEKFKDRKSWVKRLLDANGYLGKKYFAQWKGEYDLEEGYLCQ